MRTVTVIVKTRLTLKMEEGIEVGTVVNELEYDFTTNIEGDELMDTEITDHEVLDSR